MPAREMGLTAGVRAQGLGCDNMTAIIVKFT
jgi:hypothetical protein